MSASGLLDALQPVEIPGGVRLELRTPRCGSAALPVALVNHNFDIEPAGIP
ncbi:MAG: hypothetical protein VX681_14275 [Myxococcota bacterium]|nr:hypothetical protein [Myxococcota bacterium]